METLLNTVKKIENCTVVNFFNAVDPEKGSVEMENHAKQIGAVFVQQERIEDVLKDHKDSKGSLLRVTEYGDFFEILSMSVEQSLPHAYDNGLLHFMTNRENVLCLRVGK